MKRLSSIYRPTNKTSEYPPPSPSPSSTAGPHVVDRSISPSTVDSTSKLDVLTTILKGRPRMQTTIEVVKTEFGRSRRSSLLGPKSGDGNWTPIQYAALKGREAALVHFLRAGQSPDNGSQDNKSPLCIATAAGHVAIVRMLLEAGADTNAATKPEGETALHIAIKMGRTDLMDMILGYGPYLESKTTATGETPLHYAAKLGSLAAVVNLLKKGADYSALDNSNRSAAEVAFEARHINVAVAIISAARGKRRLMKEKEMLLKHVEKAQTRFSMNNELIADIFEAGCDPDSTVLVEAIKKNDVGLAEMFLEKGADPNRATASGLLPIRAAMKCPTADMVRLLAKYKVVVTMKDSQGFTLLQRLLSVPRTLEKEVVTEMFQALLHGGADPQVRYADGKTLLHHAVKPDFQLTKVAQMLLEDGVDVNAQDNSGYSALHLAIQSRTCIDVLLKHGADPNLMDYGNLTPLLYALSTSTKETEPDLDSLIRVSNLQTMAPNAKMPLHLAAENGLDRVVRTLLRFRCNTAGVESEGLTPLHLAVRNQQWTTVSVLAGWPGVNAWDKEGDTALHRLARSAPTPPATWDDIASAATKFCEKGVSRTMRDKSGSTPLIIAVKALDEDGLPVVQALLEESSAGKSNCVSHEDHKGKSALFFAATQGKLSFVTALLKHGAAFNIKDWTTNGLLKPDDATHAKILKLFAEHEWVRRGRMLQRSSMTPDSVLPKILPEEDLVLLLSMGLDPNNLPEICGPSMFWVVLRQLRFRNPPPYEYMHSLIQLLLATGADPNALSAVAPPPMPPIHPLTFILQHDPKVDMDLIELLLKNGAKLSTLAAQPSVTPLHAAVIANRLDIVDEFLTRGASVNSVDDKGRTALFMAAERGFWEVLNLLLRNGADVNVKCSRGDTALHLGVYSGSYEVVKSLITKRARVLEENKIKKRPIDLVPQRLEEKEKERLMKLLQDAERWELRDENVQQRQKELLQEREQERERREQEQQRREQEREQGEKDPGTRKADERLERERRREQERARRRKSNSPEQREQREQRERERETRIQELPDQGRRREDPMIANEKHGLRKGNATSPFPAFSPPNAEGPVRSSPTPPPASALVPPPLFANSAPARSPRDRMPFRSFSAQELKTLQSEQAPPPRKVSTPVSIPKTEEKPIPKTKLQTKPPQRQHSLKPVSKPVSIPPPQPSSSEPLQSKPSTPKPSTPTLPSPSKHISPPPTLTSKLSTPLLSSTSTSISSKPPSPPVLTSKSSAPLLSSSTKPSTSPPTPNKLLNSPPIPSIPKKLTPTTPSSPPPTLTAKPSRLFSLPSFFGRSKAKSISKPSKPIKEEAPLPFLSLNFQQPRQPTSAPASGVKGLKGSASAMGLSSFPNPSPETSGPSTGTPSTGATSTAATSNGKLPRIDSVYAGAGGSGIGMHGNGSATGVQAPKVPPKDDRRESAGKKVEKKGSDEDMRSELEGWLKVQRLIDSL